MLNNTQRYIVYLDPDTLQYMFLSYTKSRNYPVMNKLYSVLHEGYRDNLVVTPLTFEHIVPFIHDKKIEPEFLDMMWKIGQVQFFQRFTVRILQLIRVINFFFKQNYKKPVWRDAFSSNPDEKFMRGFNKYYANNAKNVLKSIEREKNNSHIYYFIDSFKDNKALDSIAVNYFRHQCEQFHDLIQPYLPLDGNHEYHMNEFCEYDGIKDIPEYQIISTILYPLFERYGIQEIESGMKDNVLTAVETLAAYMPYCHFYITSVEIAELMNMTGVDDLYGVNVYDNNEDSLYKIIADLTEALKQKRIESQKKATGTAFRKRRF